MSYLQVFGNEHKTIRIKKEATIGQAVRLQGTSRLLVLATMSSTGEPRSGVADT